MPRKYDHIVEKYWGEFPKNHIEFITFEKAKDNPSSKLLKTLIAITSLTIQYFPLNHFLRFVTLLVFGVSLISLNFGRVFTLLGLDNENNDILIPKVNCDFTFENQGFHYRKFSNRKVVCNIFITYNSIKAIWNVSKGLNVSYFQQQKFEEIFISNKTEKFDLIVKSLKDIIDWNYYQDIG